MLAEILETPEDEAGSGSVFWIVIQRLLYSFIVLWRGREVITS